VCASHSTSTAWLAAACAALKDDEHLAKAVALNEAGMQQLQAAVTAWLIEAKATSSASILVRSLHRFPGAAA
jgi:histidinol-phosphate/aromatic aminotransferase/cobyric acid decarboxylase-like protein